VTSSAPDRNGPRVVALGGGHGLAIALRAIRRYAGEITAVVSVADDGGSSGRLRRDLAVPAPGDLRKCLVALADDESLWARAFEHRFDAGELDGHAFGNLVIVGLAASLGDFGAALAEAGRLLGAVGRVVPATSEPVTLKADVEGQAVEGQVAVQNSLGRIGRVGLVPDDAAASPEAVAAIDAADQVVLAPGSLFTSVLPVLCVQGIREAVGRTPAQVVQVCNLRPQVPETRGLDSTDHLAAVLDHGVRVDAFVLEQHGPLHPHPDAVERLGVRCVEADLARPDLTAHDPGRLADVLRSLL
jgi:uncharacterized cofD-like protein